MTKHNLHNNRLMSAALAGIASVTIVQLVALNALSTSLYLAVILLSAAIPLLAVNVFALATLDEYQRLTMTPYLLILAVGGGVSAVAGLICVIAHLSYFAAGVFVVSGLLALSCGTLNDKQFEVLNEEKDGGGDQPRR